MKNLIIQLVFSFCSLIFSQQNSQLNYLPKTSNQLFIENKGQWPDEVKFLTKIGGMEAWLTDFGIVYDYYKIERANEDYLDKFRDDEIDGVIKGNIVKIEFANINKNNLSFKSIGKKEGYYNYFIGNDSTKWASNVSLYDEVFIENIYDGISVRYYYDDNNLRYDYLIEPYADVNQIKFNIEGAEYYSINQNGELVIGTSIGEVINGKIYAYEVGGNEVTCYFAENSDGSIGILPIDYNNTLALVIDPLVYSTFIGGSAEEQGYGIAVDTYGCAYIVGTTKSSDYDVTNVAYDEILSGTQDIFVTKLNAAGNGLVYSTFLGGDDADNGYGIYVGINGYAYITGNSLSNNYPTTLNAYQNYNAGASDVIVTKLNQTGSSLTYSTYIGGTYDDIGESIAVGKAGSAYIVGYTKSADYDTLKPYQGTLEVGGATFDAFVTKLGPLGRALVYSTYLGGNSNDYGNSIAVDDSGYAYIVGETSSSNFDVTTGVFQTSNQGNEDVFVTKFNKEGNGLVYSTYIGGSSMDLGRGIAIDTNGYTYITGTTTSLNYDITAGAYQTTFSSGNEVFITKLNKIGSNLEYSTYLGALGIDWGAGITVDSEGNACITGHTTSSNFDVTPDAYQLTNGGGTDVFLTKINNTGSALIYSTYIGGGSNERGHSVCLMDNDNFIITGYTESSNYDVTSGAYQTNYEGSKDGFITKINTRTIPTLNLKIFLQGAYR